MKPSMCVISLIFLFSSPLAFGQYQTTFFAPVVLQLDYRIEISNFPFYAPVHYEKSLYIAKIIDFKANSGQIAMLDFYTGKILQTYSASGSYNGLYDGKLLMSNFDRIDGSTKWKDTYFLADPRTSFVTDGSETKSLLSSAGWLGNFLYAYENGLYFEQIDIEGGEDTYQPNLVQMIDTSRRSHRPLQINSQIRAISGDKQHILFGYYGRLAVMNIQTGLIVESELQTNALSTYADFIGNGLVYCQPVDYYEGNDYFPIYRINGSKVGKFKLAPYLPSRNINNRPNRISWIKFSEDFTRAVINVTDDKANSYILDTTTFRDWLFARGYLSVPMAAIVNDTGVRLREYPNLQARVIGVLAKGGGLTVFENSGEKEIIGKAEAFWYRVQTKDALEGWVYGAYVNFSKESKPQ